MIGLPGDEIQFLNGDLFINGKKIYREKIENFNTIRCGKFILKTETFIETLPNGVKHLSTYNKIGTLKIYNCLSLRYERAHQIYLHYKINTMT